MSFLDQLWFFLKYTFAPSACWCCRRGFGKAVCSSCRPLLPFLDASCSICAEPVEKGVSVCGACLKVPPPFEKMCVAQAYQWPWTSWIPELKFKEGLARAHFLADCLQETILKHTLDLPEALIPVPLHKDRERERGFNQAAILAEPLAHFFNIPLRQDLVIRKKGTQAQSHLKARVRRKNLMGAFEVVGSIPYRHVAIVDDVITTMSTVKALAEALKKAGVFRVSVWGGCRACMEV